MATRNAWRPSLGSIFKDILEDLRELISQEARAAKIEVQEGLKNLQGAAVLFAIGGILLLMALIIASVALSLALDAYTALALWASFAVVAAGWGILGVIFLLVGKSKMRHASVVPQETAELAASDVVWMKNHYQAWHARRTQS